MYRKSALEDISREIKWKKKKEVFISLAALEN